MAVQKTPVVVGNARFTVYGKGCVRLEYAHGGKFTNDPSILIGRTAARPASADVKKTGKKLVLKTDKFELHYEDTGKELTGANLHILHKEKEGREVVWTPGKKDSGNLGEVRRCLDQWKWCGGPKHYPVEGILSTDGGHYLPDEARVYWNKKEGWPVDLKHQIQQDGYFFAYGDDYKGALKEFITVLGKIPMVPRWTFGFWYSRWYAYTDKEFIDLAKRYQKEDIPIDVMIIDTDWRDGWGGYDWSKKYFPNPRKTLATLHKMGLHTSLNDHPGYDAYERLPETDSCVPAIRKRLGPYPHQGQYACDWSNKKALDTWKDVVLGPLHDDGMDFWWIDGWIKSPFAGTDSQLWANKHYFELREEKTKKRGLILSRWGGIGSHRFPVQFSGDTPSEWHMLRYQIEFTSASAGLGAVYWSHDIGGFFKREMDEELYIRWCQFGAMSPVFRTHSDHGIREPWSFSVKAKKIFRKQTHIRYALAPLFYTLAYEAHTEGLPIARPLYLEYNDNDGGALYRKHQYTLGRDLLIIPAEGPVDAKTGRAYKKAYFPNDTWYGLETDEVRYGMESTAIEIPLDIIPTYVRRGAIIPCQPVQSSLGTQVPEEIHFDVYPDPDVATSFTLYEDDGDSKDYAAGKHARTKISVQQKPKTTTVKIAAPKGTHKGMPKSRKIVVRMRLDDVEKVSTAVLKIGKESETVKVKTTHACLAGSVKSKHRFAEVSLESSKQPVSIIFNRG